MSVEEEFAGVDGTSPSSMTRKSNENGKVNLDEDLEKGGTVNESTIDTAIEIASADHHEANDLSRCRICHSFRVNNEITEIIDLGCACKFGLSRAHKVCAEKWFEHRGRKYCEICKKVARNIPGPIGPRDRAHGVAFVGCRFWLRRRLIALVLCWVATGIFRYKIHNGNLWDTCLFVAVFFSLAVLGVPLFVDAVKICIFACTP